MKLKLRLVTMFFALLFCALPLAAQAGVKAVKIGSGLGPLGFVCALTDAGGVKCWGYGDQVGNGKSSVWISAFPTDDVVGLTSGVIDLAVGEAHACALLESGKVKCWGSDGSGQLGDNKPKEQRWVSPGDHSSLPVDVIGLPLNIKKIVAGGNSTCAITTDGLVKCWGANESGQLGDGNKTEGWGTAVPVDVKGLFRDVVDVTMGLGHTCALSSAGEVKCWGAGIQLTPVTAAPSGIAAIYPGFPAHVAVSTTGEVKALVRYDTNIYYSEFGLFPLTTQSGNPITLRDVRSFTPASFGNCTLDSGHTVHCYDYSSGLDDPPAFGGDIDKLATTSNSPAICVITMTGGVRCHNSPWCGPAADCAGKVVDIPGFGGILSATVAESNIQSPSVVTAKVSISNPGTSSVDATLSFTDSDTLSYARLKDQDEKYEAVNGEYDNKVIFKQVTLAAGETKTLEVKLLVNVDPDLADLGKQIEASADFELKLSTGQTETSTLTLRAVATGLEPSEAFRRLLTRPVGDVGTNADAPIMPRGMTRGASVGGVVPSVSRSLRADIPQRSLNGNQWDGWIEDNYENWKPEEQSIFRKLTNAGLNYRQAYSALYLKALLGLMPDLKISRSDYYKASSALIKAINKAIRTRKETPLLDFAKGLLDTFQGKLGFLYIGNLMELNAAYNGPIVNSMQEFVRPMNDVDTLNTDLCKYVEKRSAHLTAWNYARLVEADVGYRLATGNFYGKIHNVILRGIQASFWSGLSIAGALEKMLGRSDSKTPELAPCDVNRQQWTGIQIHSPLTPVVTDSQGRKAGVDSSTGTLYEEIPNAVIIPGHPWTLVVPAKDESLSIDYTTAYPYDYGIDVQGLYNGTVTSESSFQGSATKGFTIAQKATVKTGPSSVTVSVDAAPQSTTRKAEDRVFDWAEKSYASYFSPPTASSTYQDYYYRYYKDSNSYLATHGNDGKLLYLGPLSDSRVNDLGPLEDWLKQARGAGY